MNKHLNILVSKKQKIPSHQQKIVGFKEKIFSIFRKNKISGHFCLKYQKINGFFCSQLVDSELNITVI
jgi:hypothetical protein